MDSKIDARIQVPDGVDPARLHRLGVDADRVTEMVARAQEELDQGPLPSVQLAAARDGELLFSITLGDAQADSRYCTYSCIKPVVSSMVWILLDSGELKLDAPICRYLPEFGSNGKEVVTLEQVLCHTAGFPHAPMGPRHWWNSPSRRQRMSEWRLNWKPGTRFEYHATSAHWVLVELVQEVLQEDFRHALRRLVLDPLGLPNLELGVPMERQGNINTVLSVGETPSPEEVQATLGVAMDLSELGHDVLLRYNQPEVLELGVPGAGGIAGAADIAMFYQALLHDPGRLWSDSIRKAACEQVWIRFPDPSSGAPCNRSIGLVIKGDDDQAHRRGMGRSCSGRSFGHNGVGGQVAWCDPVSGLSFCLLGNGLDANPIRAARFGRAMSNRAGTLHLPYDAHH